MPQKQRPAVYTVVLVKTKMCRRCLEIKPARQFHYNKRRKDRLHTYCKPCGKLFQAESVHRTQLIKYKIPEHLAPLRGPYRKD